LLTFSSTELESNWPSHSGKKLFMLLKIIIESPVITHFKHIKLIPVRVTQKAVLCQNKRPFNLHVYLERRNKNLSYKEKIDLYGK
jgi:hypothetical protein